MLRLLNVQGDSLLPDYADGDFVLTSRIPILLGRLRPGDVVVFRHAVYGTLIKIVAAVDGETGDVSVLGTAPGSIDSRVFGPVRRGALLGRVIAHVRRPGAHVASGMDRDSAGRSGS